MHSGNILSYDYNKSKIGDSGLCQLLKEKDDTGEIFGVIPYIAPEVLSGKPYTKKSDVYSFGMIMWEHTTGKKPFHDRSHDHYLMVDVLRGARPEITDDTPEFYAKLMKKCWDHNPENRPTAKEIFDCLYEHKYYNATEENREFIKLAEAKRQEIINSDEFLSDTKNYKHHPKSFYTSRLLDDSIQQTTLINILSIEI